jgi:thiamine transport system permease protein
MSSTKERLLEFLAKKPVLNLWYGSVVIFFIAFVIIPTVFVLSYVFTGWDHIQAEVLSDPGTMSSIWHSIFLSFGIATIVTLIDILVGLPMAWLLVRKQFRGKNFLDTLIDVPLAVPTAALGFSTALFWAVTPGVQSIGSLQLFSSPVMLVVLLHVVFSYPYMVRSLAAILHEIDTNYEVAAATLGAPPLTAARTITLPLFRAGLVTGFILCFARSLSETGGTYIALSMLWPNVQGIDFSMQTGPTLIQSWKGLPGMDPQLAFVSILLIIFALILLVIVKLIVMKVKIPFRKVYPSIERLLSKGLTPKLKNFGAMLFLFLIVIIPSFFILGFIASGPGAGAAGVDWPTFWDGMLFSFIVALAATVIDLVFGVPLAILIARGKNKRLANVLDVLVNVPLIVPTAALGISLGMFWNDWGISWTMLLVISAHVAFTFPLVVRNTVGALEELDTTYEETAKTLGAKPLQVFRRVMFPVISMSVLAGAIMAFTRSLGETGATLSVAANANTIPVYIVNLVKGGSYYPAAMACLVLIVVSFITILLMRYLTRRAK